MESFIKFKSNLMDVMDYVKELHSEVERKNKRIEELERELTTLKVKYGEE